MGSHGGGGGSSGDISWPDYLESAHSDAIDAVEGIIAATSNPYAGVTSYDPSTETAAMLTATTDFEAVVDALDPITTWGSLIDTITAKFDSKVYDDAQADDDIDAFGDLLSADLTNNILPRFQGGMRDINAVQSSAFTVGQAIIEAERVRSLAKYGTELKMKLQLQRAESVIRAADRILEMTLHNVEFEKALMHYKIEANRLKIVAQKEEVDTQAEIEEAEARWDFEEYQYLANLFAGPSGGTGSSPGRKPSTIQSAIGGALSGASAGWAISGGNPMGAAIGAAVGLGASLF